MPRMTGNRYFAEAMRGYGVTHLFYMNSIIGGAMKEVESLGVKRVVTHGEKSAAYMADAYARTAGRPGICLAQDIGSTNLLAGLRDAHMASSPVIAITGGQNDEPRYRHAYQNAEDFSAWSVVTKANYSVDTVNRFPDLLRQAFRVATTGTPGPVHLELRGNAGQMLDKEGDFDLTWEERYMRFPAFRPAAEPEAVKAALAVLARASKPIIVAGGGAATSGAGPEIVKLAETLAIPIATSLNAKSIVPDDHPLNVGVPGTYSRWCANRVIAEADLVFFIGSHAGGQVTNNWMFPPTGTKVVQLDIEPRELGRNYPNAVSILGDARTSLRRMIDVAPARAPEGRGAWVKRVQGIVSEWRAENAAMRNSDAAPIRPERICKEISNVLPRNGVVVSDTGHAGIWTARMIELNSTDQRYYRTAGSLCWGFPGALGVKCAAPDRPVVCFTGDGGFYYHIAELETAARHHINAVIVVNNNSALNQEIRLNDTAYGGKQRGRAEEMWRFPDVNFAKVAEDFGCAGIRVQHPGELGDALKHALSMQKPVVVDVVSDMYAIAPHPWTSTGRDFHSYQKTGA